MLKDKQKIVVVLGPTASGKSDLAVVLAKRFKGEVISADSRQVYKELDIGTGKIRKCEMRGVPHYCLSYASPKNIHTVTQYKKYAERAIAKIIKHKNLPIICGGTGLYIDAVIYNQIFPEVKPNKELRAELERLSAGELFKKLRRLDPGRAKTIDSKNPRRLIRALEIILTTKKKVPPVQKNSAYDVLWLGIKIPENKLRERIHLRLVKRSRQGLIAEVKRLHNKGLSYRRLDDLGLEYRYASHYLKGTLTKKEMLEQLEKEIWRYAKRQRIWFKRNNEIHWVRGRDEAIQLARKFLNNYPAPNSK